MPKPDQLADDAARVAKFAAEVAAANGPPDAAPGGLAQSWLRRAELLHRWASVRPLLGVRKSDLAVEARQHALWCREHQPGAITKLTGWFSRSNGRNEKSFEDVADVLERVADELERKPRRDLGSGLSEVLGVWQDQESPPVRLAELQARLERGAAEGTGDLLVRLAAASDPPLPAEFERAALPPESKRAVGLVCRVVADLCTRTAEPDVWNEVADWTADWFAAFGVSGRLIHESKPQQTRSATGTAVAFPLPNDSGRVVLRVGTAAPAPTKPAPQTSTPASRVGNELPPPPQWPEVAAPTWLGDLSAGPKRQAAVRKKFDEWLPTKAGQLWFHNCLAAAAADHDGPAATWWHVLRTLRWCQAFPDLNPERGWEHTWPAEAGFHWPSVESAASEGQPGEVIAVRTYAPTAAAARIVIGDGQTEPGSALDRFHTLYTAAGSDPIWWGGDKWLDARTAAFEPEKHRESAERLGLGWLELVAGTEPNDPKLHALRTWCEGFGFTVLPPTPVALPARGCTPWSVFSKHRPGELVRTVRFGLLDGERVIRDADIEVSLGPAPAGLLELEQSAEALPGASPLRAQVLGLRAAMAGEYLREAAIELYISYWGDTGSEAKAAAPDASAELGRWLTQFLHDAFGLSAFSPESVRDCPDEWLRVSPVGGVCRVSSAGYIAPDCRTNTAISASRPSSKWNNMSSAQLAERSMPAAADGVPTMTWQWGSAAGAVSAGVVAFAVSLASFADGPSQFIVAASFGILIGLTIWLIADSIADRSRCRDAETKLSETPPPLWAIANRDACTASSGEATGNDCINQKKMHWDTTVDYRSWVRHAGAALVAAFGCVATFFRLTPERVMEERLLDTAFPALIGWIVWAIAHGDVLLRTAGWRSVYDVWAAWARITAQPPAVVSKSQPEAVQTLAPAGPVNVLRPQVTTGATPELQPLQVVGHNSNPPVPPPLNNGAIPSGGKQEAVKPRLPSGSDYTPTASYDDNGNDVRP